VTDPKWEKKSERLELRLPHSKKQAFIQACDEQGDTASNALRRFINSYIRRANADVTAAGLRAMARYGQHHWHVVSACMVIGLILVLGFIKQHPVPPVIEGPITNAKTGSFPPIKYNLFAAYDKNENGVLDRGEIMDNDYHVHRVLNLDGEAGIAPAKFYATGRMQWSIIKKDNIEIRDDENYPIAIIPPAEAEHIVTFNLSDPQNPELTLSEPQFLTKTKALPESFKKILAPQSHVKIYPFGYKVTTITATASSSQGSFNRLIAWTHGETKPSLIFTDHQYRPRH